MTLGSLGGSSGDLGSGFSITVTTDEMRPNIHLVPIRAPLKTSNELAKRQEFEDGQCRYHRLNSAMTFRSRNLDLHQVLLFPDPVKPESVGEIRPVRLDSAAMTRHPLHRSDFPAKPRAGQASLDWILILSTMLPIITFIIAKGKRMMALVWEMFSVQVSWPFM
jgi:hypothetical protein